MGAYDAANDTDVLFGGATYSGAPFGDTWTWDGVDWTEASPSTSPSARSDAAMAYDPSLGEVVLFGGWDYTDDVTDDGTWAWDGTTWSELSPTSSPPALSYASMVWDASLDELVLFGGYDAAGTAVDATWVFDGSTWDELDPATSPTARASAAMGYDSTTGDVVLFGGRNVSGAVLDDTWLFNGTDWVEQDPYASPVALSGASMVWDTALGGLVLFGGVDDDSVTTNQTYFWNDQTTTWELVYNNTVPATRQMAVVVPAAGGNGQLMLFGGEGWDSNLADTQIYDWGRNGSSTGDATLGFAAGDQNMVQVDLGTGNLYVAHQLWDIAGTGLDSSAYAFYNSLSGYSFDSILANLSVLPNGDVVVNFVDGTNGTLVFTETTSGYSPPAGSDMTLTYDSTASTYVLTLDQSQVTYTFNGVAPYFGLESISDRNGDTIDVYGMRIDDDRGRYVNGVTTTSGSNQVTTWTDSGLGRTWVETEPSDSVADTSITDANGDTTDYAYNDLGQLDLITDPDGHEIAIGYDDDGRVDSVTQVTDTANDTGPTTTFAWQAVPADTVVPAGTTADYEVVVANPDGDATTYVDGYGGQTLTVTDPLGHSTSATYSTDRGPEALTDALTQTTTVAYDPNDMIDEITDPASATGQNPVTDYVSYDTPTTVNGAAYLPSSSLDGEGNCTAYTYDTAGNETTTYNGLAPTSGTTNCDGKTGGVATTNAYQGDGSTSCGGQPGELCSTTSGNGNVTDYGYDSEGELTSVTQPGGSCSASSAKLCTTYTYDPDSRVATVTDEGSPGQIVEVQAATTPVSSGDVSSFTVTLPADVTCGDALVLDVFSNAETSYPVVSSISGGGVSWSLGESGGDSSVGDDELWYGLDSAGGTGTSTVTVTMSSDGNDAGAELMEFTGVAAADALDTSGGTTGSGATVSSPSLTTTAAGDLVVFSANTDTSDPTGPGAPWTDLAGPQNNADNGYGYYMPLAYRDVATAGVVSTSWSQAASDWATVGIALEPAAQTTSYSYDNEDRVTQILYGGDTACVYTSGDCVSFTYDPDGNVTSREDSTGTTTFVYDDLGRLTDEELPGGADACSGSSPAAIEYGYDADSNLTSYCDAGGTVTYAYDAAGRMIGVATGSGSCAAGDVVQPCSVYAYDAADELTSITFPTSTGVTETFAYDNAGDVTAADISGGTTTAGDYTYSYADGTDDTGLIQSMTQSATGVTTDYSYNAQEELTGANTGTASTSQSYAYDDDGNLTSEDLGGTTTTMAYNGDAQLCWALAGTSSDGCGTVPSGAVSYSYDPDGNQTGSSAGEALGYDPAGQTVSMTSPTGGAALAMAYTGVDSTQRTAAGDTIFANNAFGVASATAASATTYFTYDPTGRLDSMLVGSARYYYLYDGTGDVVGLVDSSGAQVASYSYQPYGQTTMSGTEASANPFRFQAGYEDTTGFYKFGTRYYNPALGAWTQQDPSGLSPGYTFAGDNPINISDPSGESIGSIFAGIASGIASAFSTARSLTSIVRALKALSQLGEGEFTAEDLTELGAAFGEFGPGALAGFAALVLGVAAYEALK